MPVFIVLLALLYCVCTASSIVLLGDKHLLSGNIFSAAAIIKLIFNWRFMLSMTLAILARLSFTAINSLLLKIPHLSASATTISVFISLISVLFILAANYFVLKETISFKQCIGAFAVLTGVYVMLSK